MMCSTKFVSIRDGGTASGKMMVPTFRTRVLSGASPRTATEKLTLRGVAGGTTGSVQRSVLVAAS